MACKFLKLVLPHAAQLSIHFFEEKNITDDRRRKKPSTQPKLKPQHLSTTAAQRQLTVAENCRLLPNTQSATDRTDKTQKSFQT